METRRLIVTMFYNRIAFENMEHFPDDGNGQEHTKEAALAWDSAASRYFQECSEVDGSTEIRYGNDSGRHGPFVSVHVEVDDDIYEDEPTAEELALAQRHAEAADAAGREAAQHAMWNG